MAARANILCGALAHSQSHHQKKPNAHADWLPVLCQACLILQAGAALCMQQPAEIHVLLMIHARTAAEPACSRLCLLRQHAYQ